MDNISLLSDNGRNPQRNTSSGNSTDIEGTSDVVVSARVVVSILLMIMIILGNLLIILAYQKNQRLRTGTYTFLVSLAISDFLVGSVSLPLWIYGSVRGWPLPADVYTFYICFDIFSALASTFHLTAVSVERYIAISRPFYYKTITLRSYFIGIGAAWGLAFVLAALHPKILLVLLTIPNASIKLLYQIHGIVVFSCGYLTPMVLITAVNFGIFRIARRLIRGAPRPSRSSFDSNLNTTMSFRERKLPKERKTAITLVLVTGLFFTAWMPFFIVNMLSLYCLRTCLPLGIADLLILVEFTKWLHYSNSATNVVVYAFRDLEMRKTFMLLLWPCCKSSLENRIGPAATLDPNILRTRQHSSSSVYRADPFFIKGDNGATEMPC